MILSILNHRYQTEVEVKCSSAKTTCLRTKVKLLVTMELVELRNFSTCLIIQTKLRKQLSRDLVHLYGISIMSFYLLIWYQDYHVNLITVLFIMVNGIKMGLEKGEELKSGKMAANILVTGKTIKQIVKDDLSMLMVMYMREIGYATKLMEEVFMNTLMVPSILETGKKTDKMVMVLRHGQIMQNTREHMRMVRSMVSELSSGQISQFIIIE